MENKEWGEDIKILVEEIRDDLFANWSADITPLKDFIKQLLLEREKEAVLKYILSLGWQDTDNEYVKEVLEDAERITSELSKLTTK